MKENLEQSDGKPWIETKRILNRAALAFPYQPALHELKFTEHHDKVICICNTKMSSQDRGALQKEKTKD